MVDMVPAMSNIVKNYVKRMTVQNFVNFIAMVGTNKGIILKKNMFVLT